MGLRRMTVCGVALAASCVAASCASSRAVPAPFPRPAADESSSGSSAASAPFGVNPPLLLSVPDLVKTALSLTGVPYRDGGSDPSGFDCSGFVEYVFAAHGVRMPRTVAGQFRLGQHIAADALAAGDLVFFSTIAPGASHVGIAISADRFVHAPSTSGVVRVERLSSGYWASRFVGARRIP